MNILNPKVSLFFLVFLPQFVNPSSGNITQQMFIYGVVFLIQTLIIFILDKFVCRKGRLSST